MQIITDLFYPIFAMIGAFNVGQYLGETVRKRVQKKLKK